MIDPRFTDPEALQPQDAPTRTRRWIVGALAAVTVLAVVMGLRAGGGW